jgi:hypothetical protein
MNNGECGYSSPYDGEGCDTNHLLSLVLQAVGGEITSFHGCYEASRWTIYANLTATSNSVELDNYPEYEFYSICVII